MHYVFNLGPQHPSTLYLFALDSLITGLRIVDSLLAIGRGQRQLILNLALGIRSCQLIDCLKWIIF